MNCDNFERALFYTDFPAKTFKKADKLRQLLYGEVVGLQCGNIPYLNVEKTLNDVFYLCAKLYADEDPETNIYEKYIDFDGSAEPFGYEMPESSKLTLSLVYVVLSLQQTLPQNIAYFLPYFKSIVSRYSSFQYAENIIRKWKKQYGVFMADIAPNPDIKELLLEIDELVDTPDNIKEKLLFLYPKFSEEVIESRIRLFRMLGDQEWFVNRTFDQYYRFVFNWRLSDCATQDDIKQSYLDRIRNGAYLPHYSFLFGAIPLPKETDAAEDEDDAEALRKQCEHYLANLKKREEEIERMKKEMEELKKKLAEGQKTDDSKLKQTLIEELAQVADDKEELVPLELLVGRLEDADFRKVCSSIIKKRKRELRREEVRVSQTITQSNVFNGEVNDPTFK